MYCRRQTGSPTGSLSMPSTDAQASLCVCACGSIDPLSSLTPESAKLWEQGEIGNVPNTDLINRAVGVGVSCAAEYVDKALPH